MANKENKVQFNLKNVHYAILALGETPSWGDPVAVPGAVTLTLDAEGEITPFHADGIVYYRCIANNGYSGDLEMARFPDAMQKDVWGMKEVTEDGVLIESSNVEPNPFALLYQIDGDASEQYYCLYNCTATRPGIGGATTTETKEPRTQSVSISADPLPDNRVLARTTAKTSEAVRAAWFKSVYDKTATEAATAE